MSWRSISAVAIGVLCAVAAAYWFTIGRRPIEVEDAEPSAVA